MTALLRLPLESRAAGSVRSIAVLFADTDGFSAFAERNPPEEVRDYLQIIHEVMVKAVHDHGGIVNKFLGDGLMALFGAPVPIPDREAAGLALAAGRAIVSRFTRHVPGIQPRVGIHLGEVFLGVLGAQGRHEYTAVGHAVNVAARLTATAPRLGTHLLVSDAVIEALGEVPPGLWATEPLSLKGIRQPLDAWRLA